ncbi:MAG: hypothetical protein FWG99_07055 [Treponema sp.]|nr:hypothetical protein [Treponema sp.]
MVNDKKPSIYSERSSIGSADELDEYGVWVKSEPQDLSSVSAGSQDSGDFSLPGFDTSFEELTNAVDESADFTSSELPDIDLPPGSYDLNEEDEYDTDAGSFSDSTEDTDIERNDFDISEGADSGSLRSDEHDLSTQLLMKIADELSTIRNELTGLKKEFSVIRSAASSTEKGEQPGGFFKEEEDDKIALTGDELDNILNTADFTEEAGTAELEGEISFPGISDNTDYTAFHETEAAEDIDLNSEEAEVVEDIDFSSETETVEDIDFGSETETVEGIDFSNETETAEGIDLGGETEEAEDIDFAGGIAFDDDLDISTDEAASDAFDIEDTAADSADDDSELDPMHDIFGIEDEDEPRASDEAEGEEELIDLDLEDLGIDLDPDVLLNEQSSVREELADINLEDADLDADISEIQLMDETDDSEEIKQLREEGAVPMTYAPDDSSYLEESPDDISFDSSELDLSEAVIEEPDLSSAIVENPLTEPSLDMETFDDFADISLDDEEILGDAESIVEEDSIEEAEGIEEESPVEAELPVQQEKGDVFDISLSSLDDDIEQVIPEGFEATNGEVPVPFDDDLEADVEEGLVIIDTPGVTEEMPEIAEESIEELPVSVSDKVPLDIPAKLKSELRTVLSYMDQLLESLPEEKIEEFAKSKYFDSYKKLFKELGLV